MIHDETSGCFRKGGEYNIGVIDSVGNLELVFHLFAISNKTIFGSYYIVPNKRLSQRGVGLAGFYFSNRFLCFRPCISYFVLVCTDIIESVEVELLLDVLRITIIFILRIPKNLSLYCILFHLLLVIFPEP